MKNVKNIRNVITTDEQYNSIEQKWEKYHNGEISKEEYARELKKSLAYLNNIAEEINIIETPYDEKTRGELFKKYIQLAFYYQYAFQKSEVKGEIKRVRVRKPISASLFNLNETVSAADIWAKQDVNIPTNIISCFNKSSSKINILFDVIAYLVYNIALSFEVISDMNLVKNWTIKGAYKITDRFMCYLGIDTKCISDILDDKMGLNVYDFTPFDFIHIGLYEDMPISNLVSNLTIIIYSYIKRYKNYEVITKMLEVCPLNEDIFVSSYLASGSKFRYIKTVGTWWIAKQLNNGILEYNFDYVMNKETNGTFYINTLLDSSLYGMGCSLLSKPYKQFNIEEIVQEDTTERVREIKCESNENFKDFMLKNGYDNIYLFMTYNNIYVDNSTISTPENELWRTIGYVYFEYCSRSRIHKSGYINMEYFENQFRIPYLHRIVEELTEGINTLEDYMLFARMLVAVNYVQVCNTDSYIIMDSEHISRVSDVLSMAYKEFNKYMKNKEFPKKVETYFDFLQAQYIMGINDYIAWIESQRKMLISHKSVYALYNELLEARDVFGELSSELRDVFGGTHGTYSFWLSPLENGKIEGKKNIEYIRSLKQYQLEHENIVESGCFMIDMHNLLRYSIDRLKYYRKYIESQRRGENEKTELLDTIRQSKESVDIYKNASKKAEKALADMEYQYKQERNKNEVLEEKIKSLSFSESEHKELEKLREEKAKLEALLCKKGRLLESSNNKLKKLREQLSTYTQVEDIEEVETEELITYEEKVEILKNMHIIFFSGMAVPKLEEMGIEYVFCAKDSTLSTLTKDLRNYDCIVVNTDFISHSITRRITSTTNGKVPVCPVTTTNVRLICEAIYDYCKRKGVI